MKDHWSKVSFLQVEDYLFPSPFSYQLLGGNTSDEKKSKKGKISTSEKSDSNEDPRMVLLNPPRLPNDVPLMSFEDAQRLASAMKQMKQNGSPGYGSS